MAIQSSTFPLRTIHLDFHTGPWVPDVARDFDAKSFARTFRDAHVDCVTVFAKCHHGHLYYSTDHPARHPALPKGFDLLEAQIAALHSEGIRAPIYLSVQCDEYAANQHPEWVACDSESKQVKWGNSAFEAGWQILDMSSPYQDYLADQLAEVLKRFAPIDGVFLDMCWDQTSCTQWAINGMKRSGLNPTSEADRSRYARQVTYRYMERFKKMVDGASRSTGGIGVWFNSRPKINLDEEKRFVDHIEVEALPTGGWGYSYFPYVSRFVRPLQLPVLSHTGRFHKSWGDHSALKPAAALKYECCQILSQNMSVGVGDLLHPRGVPHAEVYRRIGGVYEYIQRCQEFLHGAATLSEVAIVVDQSLGDAPGPSGIGAVRALQQLRHQFDIVSPRAKLENYRVAIVPETTTIDAELASCIRKYLGSGGRLLLAGRAAFAADGTPVLSEAGLIPKGPSPYTHTFLRPIAEIGRGIPAFDFVMYERGFRVLPGNGARALCLTVEPYFERSYDHFSGHSYTPPDRVTDFAAIVQNENLTTFAVPIFEAFAKHGNPEYRQLIGNCIDALLPRPLIRDRGPAHLEVLVAKNRDATIVHLISFLHSRQAENLDLVHDPFPLVNLPLFVRMDQRPMKVTLEPAGENVPFTFQDGYVSLKPTVLDGHAMLVITTH